MRRILICITSLFLFASSAFGQTSSIGAATTLSGVSSGKLGAPVNGRNGKIYIADFSNSRLFVVNASDDAVSTVSLPGQPGTLGGALSVSKDGSLLAVPLASGSIAVLNLSTNQIAATYSTSGRVPVGTAFGASNNHIFFSTDQNFDDVYLLDTGSSTVTNHFGIGVALGSDGTDLQLETNSAGTTLYVLERFGSPGGLHKIDVTNPLSPSFIAEDEHGDLGSNCRGLALIPGGVAPPSQGHEAYISCGAPYHVQAITQSGSRLLSTTQFATEPYPTAVETLSNGDVVAVRDVGGTEGAVFLFTSGAQLKYRWAMGRGVYEQVTSDGVAGTLVNDSPKIYVTLCGISPTSATNCSARKMSISSGGGDGGGNDGETETPKIDLSLAKTKFPAKAGVLKVTADITGTPVSNVVATFKRTGAKFTAKLKQSTTDSSNYTVSVAIPKNKTKAKIVWSVTVSATIDGASVKSSTLKLTVNKP